MPVRVAATVLFLGVVSALAACESIPTLKFEDASLQDAGDSSASDAAAVDAEVDCGEPLKCCSTSCVCQTCPAGYLCCPKQNNRLCQTTPCH
jgi:hypothetical protein